MVSAVRKTSPGPQSSWAPAAFSREMRSTVSRGERPWGTVSFPCGTRTSKPETPICRSSSCRRGDWEQRTSFAMPAPPQMPVEPKPPRSGPPRLSTRVNLSAGWFSTMRNWQIRAPLGMVTSRVA